MLKKLLITIFVLLAPVSSLECKNYNRFLRDMASTQGLAIDYCYQVKDMCDNEYLIDKDILNILYEIPYQGDKNEIYKGILDSLPKQNLNLGKLIMAFCPKTCQQCSNRRLRGDFN